MVLFFAPSVLAAGACQHYEPSLNEEGRKIMEGTEKALESIGCHMMLGFDSGLV